MSFSADEEIIFQLSGVPIGKGKGKRILYSAFIESP